jgi:hypothetical protein
MATYLVPMTISEALQVPAFCHTLTMTGGCLEVAETLAEYS